MTIGEMHISVQQGIQKISSHQVDIFLPQEMDLAINKNIEKFVSQRYGKQSNSKQKGFEESQKRIDDLRTLVVEYSNATSFKAQIGENTFIDTFRLPVVGNTASDQNYRHLINVRALVVHQGCKKLNWEYEHFVNTCACSVLVPGSTVQAQFDNCAAVVPAGNWICTYNLSDYRIAGTYLVDASGNLVYDMNGTLTLDEGSKSNTMSSCKFVQQDDIFELLQDPFNKPKITKPMYTVLDENLDMYTDNSFIVSSVKITYLKHPATVNIMSNTSCDLPIHTHQEIVDMTINSLLEAISDPRYQTQSVEVLKSE
tara:strand:- start:15102 stop:16037 length:936 start_codon:yes stop_codon:yes gene_type:complete